MSKLTTTFNPEQVDNLDVEVQYQQTIQAMEATHKELSAMPQDPNAPTQSLNSLKEQFGVQENKNDFSMFMSSAMASMAADMLVGVTGVGGAAATGMQVAASMATEREGGSKPTFKRATTANSNEKKSVFSAPKPSAGFKRAARPVAQTSFMRRAMQKQARQKQFREYMATRVQRRAHENKMQEYKAAFHEMNTLKSQGVATVSQSENGKVFNAKASPHNARHVFKRDQKRYEAAAKLENMGFSRNYTAPALRMSM